MSAPAIILSPRDQWLAERRRIIGASECAAILGADPRRDQLDVYADKVAGRLDDSEESWLAFGRDVEGAIAKGYAYKSERPVRDLGAHTIQHHPDLHFLGATLDRETEGSTKFPAPMEGAGPLELKAVGFHKQHEWAEEPPLAFVIQVQVQMACTRAAWGSLGALFGGIQIAEPLDFLRNDEFLKVAYEALARFWWRVQHRQPPEPTSESRDAIKRLWPTDNGEVITLGEEERKLADRLEIAKGRVKRAESVKDEIENRLRVRMGEAKTGNLPDRTALVLATENVAEHVRKASVRRILRRWRPKDLRQKALKS
jgi:putative phage-type endonuclease